MRSSRSTFTFTQIGALQELYPSYGLTPERIACNDEHREDFVIQYREMTGDLLHSGEEILLQLFNIRRNGQLERLGREVATN